MLEEIRARDTRADYGVKDFAYQRYQDRRWLLEQLDVCLGALRAARQELEENFGIGHCVVEEADRALAALEESPTPPPAAAPCPGTPVDRLAFGRPNPRRRGQYTEGEHCACCAKGELTWYDRTYLDKLKIEIGSDRYLWALIDRLAPIGVSQDRHFMWWTPRRGYEAQPHCADCYCTPGMHIDDGCDGGHGSCPCPGYVPCVVHPGDAKTCQSMARAGEPRDA